MAVFKPIVNHGRGDGRGRSADDLDRYLSFGDGLAASAAMEEYLAYGHAAKVSRVVEFRHTDNMRTASPVGWSREMDTVRRLWGKAGGRQFYHWVLSPDPRDKVSPQECADIAMEWLRRRYPDGQAVVAVHDDNERGIVHAHIVLNAVYPVSGRKVQIGDRDRDADFDEAQRVCREHGFAYMDDMEAWRRDGERRSRASRRSRAEQEMRRRGQRSWVAEIREEIDVALSEARSWPQFMARLAAAGVAVTRESVAHGGGLVFRHPDAPEHGMRIRARNLGEAYTEEAMRSRLGFDWDGMVSGDGSLLVPVPRAAIDFAKRHEGQARRWTGRGQEDFEGRVVRVLSTRAHRRNIDQSIRALATIRREGVGSLSELDAMATEADRTVAKLEAEAKAYSAAMEDAAAVLAAARSLPELRQREAEAEVTARHATFLNPRARRELAEATEARRSAEAKVSDGLGRAAQVMASLGLERASDEQKAVALVRAVRDRAERASADLDGARARLDELALAGRVVAGAMTVTVPEHGPTRAVTGRISGRPAAPARDGEAERARAAYESSMRAARKSSARARAEWDAAMARAGLTESSKVLTGAVGTPLQMTGAREMPKNNREERAQEAVGINNGLTRPPTRLNGAL